MKKKLIYRNLIAAAIITLVGSIISQYGPIIIGVTIMALGVASAFFGTIAIDNLEEDK